MTDQDCQEIARALGIPADLLLDALRDAGIQRAIKNEIKRAIGRVKQTPKTRGPRSARTPTKKRRLAREFERFARGRRESSRSAILPHFVKRTGAPARANISGRGDKVISKGRLRNLLGEGDALLRFTADPQFRRWARALRASPAIGAKQRFWKEVRAALDSDKPGDYTELAGQAEFVRIMGERALLGDSWRDGFVTIDRK